MNKKFMITKLVQIFKGYATGVVTFEKPAELIINPKNKTYRVNNGFEIKLNYYELTFITEDNSIIKYHNDLLTIVSEKILE